MTHLTIFPSGFPSIKLKSHFGHEGRAFHGNRRRLTHMCARAERTLANPVCQPRCRPLGEGPSEDVQRHGQVCERLRSPCPQCPRWVVGSGEGRFWNIPTVTKGDVRRNSWPTSRFLTEPCGLF